jgi:hypothetical protein
VRRTASILSVVLGAILIIGGVATWIVVSTTLADQQITVSDNASCLAGDEVNGPFSAYCEGVTSGVCRGTVLGQSGRSRR